MPKLRTRPTNPYLSRLIASRGYKNLKEAAEATGVSDNTLYGYADVTDTHQSWSALIKFCDSMGVSIDEFVRGMLSADSVLPGRRRSESA